MGPTGRENKYPSNAVVGDREWAAVVRESWSLSSLVARDVFIEE